MEVGPLARSPVRGEEIPPVRGSSRPLVPDVLSPPCQQWFALLLCEAESWAACHSPYQNSRLVLPTLFSQK